MKKVWIIGLAALVAGCSCSVESEPTPAPTPTPTTAPVQGNFVVVSSETITTHHGYDFTVMVIRDRETGCEYILRPGDSSAFAPRLNTKGTQVCNREVITDADDAAAPQPAVKPSEVGPTPTPTPTSAGGY